MNRALYLIGLTIGLGAIGGGAAWRYYQPEPAVPSTPPTVEFRRTVTWFIDHTEERKVKLRLCQDDPGHSDPDCVNAEHARMRLSGEDYLAKTKAAGGMK